MNFVLTRTGVVQWSSPTIVQKPAFAIHAGEGRVYMIYKPHRCRRPVAFAKSGANALKVRKRQINLADALSGTCSTTTCTHVRFYKEV